jgi:hypothetical protein
VTGLVQPLRVYGSGKGPTRTFDMSNEAESIELYQIVLTDGMTEDVWRYINREELLLWSRLWLSPHVRQVWEPRLGVPRRDSGPAAPDGGHRQRSFDRWRPMAEGPGPI